jgi:hypothetical protein
MSIDPPCSPVKQDITKEGIKQSAIPASFKGYAAFPRYSDRANANNLMLPVINCLPI